MGGLHNIPDNRGKENRLVGIRKLLVVLCVIGVTAAIPINENQADVFKWVLITFVGGNAVEHVMKGEIREKIVGMARSLRSATSSTIGNPAEEEHGEDR